jgi:hypothetical protein
MAGAMASVFAMGDDRRASLERTLAMVGAL